MSSYDCSQSEFDSYNSRLAVGIITNLTKHIRNAIIYLSLHIFFRAVRIYNLIERQSIFITANLSVLIGGIKGTYSYLTLYRGFSVKHGELIGLRKNNGF